MMISKRLVSFSALVVCASLFGLGCTKTAPSSSGSSQAPSGPKPANFDGLSPSDAAKKIQFVGGNVIVMKQGFGGIAGKLADAFNIGGSEGERDIVIRSFSPSTIASIDWKLSTKAKGETRQTTGSISGGDLGRSHTLFLPGYWRENDQMAFGTSLLWLSSDVYEDLAKLRNSSLDFGLFTPALIDQLPKSVEFTAALAKLKSTVNAIGNKKDVYYLEADKEPTQMKLVVNGKDVTVQTITARNWFGEIVVLDSKNDPLVLKVTLNPVALAAVDSVSGSNFLKEALGYEVTEIKDIQE